MQSRHVARRSSALLLALAAGNAALAAPPPLPPLAPTAPLVLAHARPEGLELDSDVLQRWRLVVTAAAGNTFTSTHQIARAHAAVDAPGSELSAAARAYARLHWPEDLLFHLDAETQVLLLEAAGPLGRSAYGGVRVTSWRLGGAGLDALPEWWHDLIGLDDADRPQYPRDHTVLWVREPGREVLVSAPLGPHLGGTTVWVGRELPRLGRVRHRTWAVASLPGSDTSALGRSGVAWGARWAARTAIGDAVALDAGVGYTVRSGETLWGSDTADSWHTWLGAAIDLGRGWGVSGLVRADASPLRGAVAGRLAEPGGELALGLTRRLSRSSAVQLALGEDVPGTGASPDFSLQLRLLVQP